ncbi:BGN_3a_G0007250.mRNA.1.CDS.1 [Saccharomyces cerevisiae]|nr:Cop1p [Saccharomyces cerevisiae FostersB]CAI4305480.1 BGN_3a_G0007250.mRNA.1.CDS.1 [Saccharomyces cerevisiae]CAI4311325.1 AIG_G0007490.mRNA.1.CDS.1 [Saccharomyces cerevisiae]CAI6536197.1 AIG_G0007490.mRNA.1.CDS.1 [Saccharomyces cerevisiae]CAI6537075.1 AAB_G0007570.mRNA.1.CDS.1 [Saccharomyces cerevisiae]
MKMLTKFESKSTRAKGIAFHPSRPWVLVALFSSTIQLWDYRMGTLLHRFEDHEGPVRGLDFHPTQPIFVSAGDDYTIKVWSLDTNKCLYTLTGHLDYVRTVFFHRELPWIISASDDQTIRIWNWQNRKEIACLTGHNHFVMCAQFHPTDDLIVSASLDETIRIWDISGLRKRHSAPGTSSFEEQMSAQQNLLDGSLGDCVVKFILEGHTRGVNWASFHPTLPLIVSGSDDRQVKLWRMSATKAWEVDTCRGHTNNVDSVIFHPHQNLIISVGEDKTLRVWDLDKRTPVKQFKRENDRFWLIAAHPHINLFGAAHDSGIMVFKLDRERPCSFIHQNQLFFVNAEKQIQSFNFQKRVASLPYASLKGIGQPWDAFRSISYNPSQHSVLVNEANGKFALVILPKQPVGAVEPTSVTQDTGNFATFVGRNRFVVYNKNTESVEVRSLENKVTRNIKVEETVRTIVAAGPGSVLVIHPREVILYDVQQGKKVSQLAVKNVKYVSWSLDGQYVALMSKHTITLATKKLELINSMHETIRIKSAAWDETGVLIYSTLNHIRYSLLNGDRGIIKTLEKTLYITKVQGKLVYCLNREGEIEILTIDPTEYRFKKALVNKNFPEVLRLIKDSNLVGQNIISYLQKSGYPEIALQFVQDPHIRFDLALEYGNLDVALDEAKKLNDSSTWERLIQEALAQGNASLAEMIYQTQHSFDKLSFLYLVTGDVNKLSKMQNIAQTREDFGSMLLNTFYNNSTKERSSILAEGGSLPLAYAVAKANGDEAAASAFLEQAEVDEQDVTLPDQMDASNFVQRPVISKPLEKWPLKEAELSYFEKAVLGQIDDLTIDDETPAVNTTQEQEEPLGEENFNDEDIGEDEGAWDLGDEDLDVGEELPEEVEQGEITSPAREVETAIWIKNSKLPAVLVAAGAFDAAVQALSKQVGVVKLEPLKKYFTNIYEGCRTYIPSTPCELPAQLGYVRAYDDTVSEDQILPYVPGLDVVNEKMNEGYKNFKLNKLDIAIECFREAIYRITLLMVDNTEDEKLAHKILETAREYILGLSIELERRSLKEGNTVRMLELAAYFTKAKLSPIHRTNALQVAMSQHFKHKNFLQASYFAGEFLKIISSGPRAEQARKIKNKADSMASDAIPIDFDPYAKFDICAATYKPIYEDTPSVSDPLTGSKYVITEKDKIDRIAMISKIGAPASGLRIRV